MLDLPFLCFIDQIESAVGTCQPRPSLVLAGPFQYGTYSGGKRNPFYIRRGNEKLLSFLPFFLDLALSMSECDEGVTAWVGEKDK